MPGQAAFGAIQEVVQILEADSTTDWSKVTAERQLDTGVEIAVTGDGRTLEIKRMVPAHVGELTKIGLNAKTGDLQN
jgi:hypothetical protein